MRAARRLPLQNVVLERSVGSASASRPAAAEPQPQPAAAPVAAEHVGKSGDPLTLGSIVSAPTTGRPFIQASNMYYAQVLLFSGSFLGRCSIYANGRLQVASAHLCSRPDTLLLQVLYDCSLLLAFGTAVAMAAGGIHKNKTDAQRLADAVTAAAAAQIPFEPPPSGKRRG